MPITRVDVDQAERERDRQHQREEPAHRRVAPVEREPQPAVEPAQPGQRQQQLDERRDEDRARVDVQLRVLAVRRGHAEDEPEDDHEVPGDGGQRRHGEVVVRVEDPDDDAGEAEQDDDREEDAREADREVGVSARVAEQADDRRARRA